jgi:hypothetical protein
MQYPRMSTIAQSGRHCMYCGEQIQAAFYVPGPPPAWACPPCYFDNYLPDHAKDNHMVAYGKPALAGVA